jgi:hypothetical protein
MQCRTMVIIMQRAIVVLVSIHLCSHYYLAIMVSFSSINHGTTTMLHISLSRRSTAASSIAYDEGGIHGITASIVIIIWSRSAASMVSLVCGATPHLLSHPPVEPCIVCIVYGLKCQILLKGNREGTLYIFSKKLYTLYTLYTQEQNMDKQRNSGENRPMEA